MIGHHYTQNQKHLTAPGNTKGLFLARFVSCKRLGFLFGIVLCALLCLTALHGQLTDGAIVGSVTDNTGAAIPKAAVTVTNLGTAEERTDRTDQSGNYRILNLPPGQYREDVEANGFKHFTRQPIDIEVGGTVRIDVPVEIGTASETVNVTTETPLLQTDDATLSQVVSPKTVQQMPLNGRNVMNLVALVPGVVPQGDTAGGAASNAGGGHTQIAGYNNYQIGGGIAGQSTSFVDGAPANGFGGNLIVLVPTQDATEEFRVATNSPSAEFGRYGGGVILFSTKSGSNDFHGTVYEYFRNKVLNTTPFFTKYSNLPKPPYNQNQYGGAFGGPIKKDKIFFFLNYEELRSAIGGTVVTTVPTQAERNGDFSADAPIYNPYTTQVVNGTVTRQQFPGNKIPMQSFDSTANIIMNVMQYYPLPNTHQPGGNYANTPVPGANERQGTARGDFNLSEKQHLFARYTYWSVSDIPQNVFNNLTANGGSDFRTQQAVVGDTYAFSPNTIFDLRLSYTRQYADDNPPSLGRSLAAYGPAWATLQNQVTFALNITPMIAGLYPFNGQENISRQFRNNYAIVPGVSLIRGRHVLKFGADLRLLDFNFITTNNSSGLFYFNSGFTSSNGTTSAGTGGNAIASFLLGAPYQGLISTAHTPVQNSFYQAYYGNDTWQVRPNLTLNLGLRWELPGAWTERHNLATVLLPDTASSLGAGYHGGLALVNSADWSHNSTEQAKHYLFAPRLGVSYSPTSTTVLRAGYGITYIALDTFNGAMPFLSPVNSAVTNMVTSVNNQNLIPLNTLSNPFPLNGVPGTIQQSIQQPSGRSPAYLNSLNGLSISGPVPYIRFPYVQQWNTSLQQQLLGGALFQIAYAGSRGTFLPLGVSYNSGSSNNLNQLPDQYDSLGNALLAQVPNPLAGQLNPTGSLNGATVPAGQLLRPYPQYSNVVQTNAKGDNIYHSLQVSFEKRFGAGGILMSNYTWAKNIGDVTGTGGNFLEQGQTIGLIQDYTNLRAERSPINFDVRQRFVTSYVVPLPFGRGQRYFSDATGIGGGFVSGWEVNGIVTFQTGFPLSIVAQNNALANSFGAGTIRPNVVPGCAKAISGPAQARIGKWFNTSCFTPPGNFSFGNEPRVDSALRASGIADYDFSLSKNMAITERLQLSLRAEVFNLFNRVQFSTPATTLGQGNFGTVTAQYNQPRLIQLSGRLNF